VSLTISGPAGRLGSQRPRLSSVPPASSSAGGDATEYAASVGLVLDPWQSFVLDGALGEVGRMWAAFEVGVVVTRQNGKGVIIEARELAGVALFGERLIIHTAHELKTAEEAFLRMEALCEDSPELCKASGSPFSVRQYHRSNGKEAITFKNGARIKYVARSKGSGRGFSGDLIVLDEAMFLTTESMSALLPTLTASPNPQVWYTGSAGLEESTHLRSVRERAQAGGDPSLAYFEWSAEDNDDFDDPAVWAKANPALGIHITEDRIRMERAALDEVGFAREHLGIWYGADLEAIIPLSVWEASFDGMSQALDPVAFALDVPPDRTSCAIAMAGRRRDGKLHVEVVDHRKGTGWAAVRMVELVRRWRPSVVVVDPAGPAGSLLADLESAGVQVTKTSGQEMAQACGMFYDAAVDDRVRHIGQPVLNAALGAARKRNLGDAWAWHRRDRTDISPLVAVTLAAFGHWRQPPSAPSFVPRRVR
jgi:phage terminase large subunit-like protein